MKSGGLPSDIPATPERIYKKEGWTGLGDWLGTDTIATHKRKYRSFTRARSFARSLKLRNKAEWTSHMTSRKLEPDIPADPRNTYKDKGWSGWRDWLGTD